MESHAVCVVTQNGRLWGNELERNWFWSAWPGHKNYFIATARETLPPQAKQTSWFILRSQDAQKTVLPSWGGQLEFHTIPGQATQETQQFPFLLWHFWVMIPEGSLTLLNRPSAITMCTRILCPSGQKNEDYYVIEVGAISRYGVHRIDHLYFSTIWVSWTLTQSQA